MVQKRKQYVKTANGLEEQHFSSSADIVSIDKIDGLNAKNVQEALEELKESAAESGVTGVKGDAETAYRTGNVNITPANIGLGNVTNDAQVKRTEMGASGGVATLDETGKVHSSQLPSYVDDVLEYDRYSAFPSIGEGGKIYVAKDTGVTYRWGGTTYAEISASLALGETAGTAYYGEKGKLNAENIEIIKGQIQGINASIINITNGTTEVGKATTAGSADKLSNKRDISINGDATASAVGFDGSEDIAFTLTLSNSGVTSGTYSVLTVDAKGRATAGAQLVEWGTKGQTSPSTNLAIGGIFFELVE